MSMYISILLGVAMVLFILFLRTESGNSWMRRYGARLRTNNNVRAKLCWIVTAVLFTARLLFCAGDTQRPLGLDAPTPHYSERTQEFLRLYEQAKMDARAKNEPKSNGGALTQTAQGTQTLAYGTWHAVHKSVCWFTGYTVLFLVIFSPIYTVIAFRDECMEAVENAKDKAFGHRSGEENLPDVKETPPPAQSQPPPAAATNPLTSAARQPLSFGSYFKYEFIFALASELINLFIHRRRP